ncbi:MAG: phosphate regulon sensor histidine kinase PhoR [Burkholderiaceae bacterium]
MGTRIFLFLTCLLAGTLSGWLLSAFGASGWSGATAGLLTGIVLWFALDFVRARRVLRWLRTGAPAPAPRMHGAWGEMADRTARLLRQRDRQLRASDQRLQDFLSAIQASPNGVVLLDADNRIEWCSESAANQLDIDATRDLAAHITNLVRAPAFVQYLAGQDYRRDVGIDSRRRAAPRASRLSLQVHPYGDGRKLLLARDITALEQADAMRRDFVANVSHEIRTPLTVVAGFVETLQTVALAPEEQARYLKLMAQQTDRMQALVNDLLALSRLEGSPPPSAGHWLDVAALMREVEQESHALAQLLAGENGTPHAIRLDPGDGWQVAGSEAELRSALVNLVNNAVRYTAPGNAAIELRFAPMSGGGYEWSVRDYGAGIAPEHLPRLSERFYRIDRSRSRETGGTGLGLAIAKHVAQRHGGELRIDSAPGRGSRFALVLPAARVRVGPGGGDERTTAAPIAAPAASW